MMGRRQFVLEVAAPLPAMQASSPPHSDFNPGHKRSTSGVPPRPPTHAAEVINFGKSNKASRARPGSGSYSSDRDPLKIRDGVSSHNSRSGVYTPATFPGPVGRPTPMPASPSAASVSPTSPTSSTFARQQRTGMPAGWAQSLPRRAPPPPVLGAPAPPPTSSSVRGKMHFKRRSADDAPRHRQAHHSVPTIVDRAHTLPSAPLHAPQQQYEHQPSSLQRGFTPANVPLNPTRSRQAVPAGVVYTPTPRPGYSPSSAAHSVSSLSPPGTPTTPSSFMSHSKEAAILPADTAPHFGGSNVSSASASTEGGVVTPKSADMSFPTSPPGPRGLTLMQPPPKSPAVTRDVPLSPGAPKRARRKPVPRFDDDLLERMERLEAA